VLSRFWKKIKSRNFDNISLSFDLQDNCFRVSRIFVDLHDSGTSHELEMMFWYQKQIDFIKFPKCLN
jgi:hypothetical protein